MNEVLIWLWFNLAIACAVNFLKDNKSSVSAKVFGAIIVSIIGPFLFPSFVFSHILKLMKED